jgi:signal transduction histidine kinase
MFLQTRVRHSLKARVAVFAFLGITLIFILAGSLLIASFRQSAQQSLDNYLLAFMNSLIAATSVDKNGTITLLPSGLDNLPQYWQITSQNKKLQKSPQLQAWVSVLPARDGKITRSTIYDSDNTAVYVLTRTIRFPGNIPVTYMIGVQQDMAKAFISGQQKQFLPYLITILSLLAFLLVLLSLAQVYFIMRPLQQLKTSVAAIKDGTDSVFSGRFPTEIQPLVDELNLLLSYNAHMLERYRSFSANLSHALKTPLAILRNEAKDSPIVMEKTQDMENVINRYLARVRIGGSVSILAAHTSLGTVLEKICRSFGKLYRKDIRLDIAHPITLRMDEADLYELLGNLIENACKYGRQRVEVSAISDNGEIIITINDDGPGIPPETRQEVVKRGIRLDEKQAGSGIGIPIAIDIVTLYGGSITLQDSPLQGLQVVVKLPETATAGSPPPLRGEG